MSLRSKMKTDLASATGGVWYHLNAYPNADKSIPAFLLARQSMNSNPHYADAMQDMSDRSKPAEEQLSVDDTMRLDVRVFLDGILMDWKNFEPDTDGVRVAYSKDEAERIFMDRAWGDLKGTLVTQSGMASNYNTQQRELAAKNSSKPSVSTSTESTSTPKPSTPKKPASVAERLIDSPNA